MSEEKNASRALQLQEKSLLVADNCKINTHYFNYFVPDEWKNFLNEMLLFPTAKQLNHASSDLHCLKLIAQMTRD